MVCLKTALQSTFTLALSTIAIAGLLGLGEAIASPFRSDALAAELQDVQERGFLIVAVKDNVRPLGFRTEADEVIGLEIDIAQRLATEIFGTPDALQIQPVSNAERLPSLLDGDVDVVIAQLGMTDARSRLVDFSIPYYLDGTGFVTRSANVQRLTDLSDATIVVLNHSTTIDVVRSFFPRATLVGADSYQDALSMLESGQADAFSSDASILTGWIQEYPNYRLIPRLISGDALAIAMPRGLQYEDFRQLVNRAIERWRREGWLQERAIYWGLP